MYYQDCCMLSRPARSHFITLLLWVLNKMYFAPPSPPQNVFCSSESTTSKFYFWFWRLNSNLWACLLSEIINGNNKLTNQYKRAAKACFLGLLEANLSLCSSESATKCIMLLRVHHVLFRVHHAIFHATFLTLNAKFCGYFQYWGTLWDKINH